MFVEWFFSAAVLSFIAASQDIGRGKRAYQITTVPLSGYPAGSFRPGLAVDGNTECQKWYSHTDNHQMPWWAVDLGDYYVIDYVQVTPREWLEGYSGNFTILLGSDRYSLPIRSTFTECASGYGNDRKWLHCSSWGLVGRHVVVQRERERDVRNLCLCEVVVQGKKACPAGKMGRNCWTDCSDGKWGPQCAFTCSNGCRNNTCDNVTGACQCKDGWFGALCDRNCSDNCITPGVCDESHGSCRCKPGYQPPTCRFACARGFFGEDCLQVCSSGCRSGDCNNKNGTCFCLGSRYRQNCTGNCGNGCISLPCDKSTGHCTCLPGWRPPLCNTRCNAGFYGQNCNKTCGLGCDGKCVPQDGRCKRCLPGWYGYLCDKKCGDGCMGSCDNKTGSCRNCKVGFYGNMCHLNCSVGCQDNSCEKQHGDCSCRPGYRGLKCDMECSPGYWGKECKETCSRNCMDKRSCNIVDGSCICKPGFKGHTCGERCEAGFYGHNCSTLCPPGCDGICVDEDGRCRRCQVGWFGYRCERRCEIGCIDVCDKKSGLCTRCYEGFYGNKCHLNCSIGCHHNSCDKRNGSCNCRPGYKGITCDQECEDGRWGSACVNACSSDCESSKPCNKTNGACICKPGFKGVTCKTPCEEGRFGFNCQSTCYCKGGHVECSKVNGTCESGQCVDGREGVACQKLRNDPTDTSALGIGLGVGVLFVLIIALVLLVIFIRRRRTRENPPKIDNETSDTVAFSSTTQRTEVKNEPNLDNITRPKVNTAEPVNDDAMSADVTCQEVPDGLVYENMGIRVVDFPNYVQRMKGTEKGFQQEYESLPTGLKAPCEIGSTAEASVRNRFKNIIAYDHSRVSIEGDTPLSQYINANFINGFGKTKDFIAAQGPVKETVADFIQMLWEQKVPLIVMVTNLKEKEKPKCYQYWPNQAITGKIIHRGITVSKIKEETLPHYVIRHLELEKNNVKQPLAQVQYISWPDHGVPESPAAFLDFHQKAKHLYQSEVGPTVVHCSAGVGRTGTFLAVDYLLEQAKHEGYLNIASCVKRMREDRVNMVQSLDQYVFIHECMLEALHCGKTVYDASSYDAFASSLDKTELMKQYGILDKLKPTVSVHNLEVANREENINKNRSEHVLTNTKWRPLLMTDAQGTNDYINAVFVHAYQKKHAYIATQSPLPATMVDLWRLVQDYKCSTIIALNDTGNNEVCPNYWGEEEEQIGPFIISEETETESNGYVRRQLKLKYKEEDRKVMQFQVKSWTHGTLPAAATLLSLYEEVKAWQQESGDSRIVVHCLYGAAETGLYLCLCHVCDKIGREQEVDVFHAVQLIRKSQPLFITNLEQYYWLHQTAYEYISSFSMYANFK